MANKVWRWLAPWLFSIGASLGALGLIGLITFALYDSVTSAKISEEQVRATTLAAELSNFLLATKEPDGSSLLENPQDFSFTERSLGFVQVRRPFYSYLLNRANAQFLTAEKISWEQPRPCILEFSNKTRPPSTAPPFSVQACFAVIPSETNARYAYFTIRYPVQKILRHRPGTSLSIADKVILTFGTERPLSVILVYQPPRLAISKHPSQIERFIGIHEMSAFYSSNPTRAIWQINAQAFERLGEGNDKRNYVTIVGRIEASLLDAQAGLLSQQWPTSALKTMPIGLKVFRSSIENGDQEMHVSPSTKGLALVSLQNVYLASVPSRSLLNISSAHDGKRRVVWSSSELTLPATPRRSDWRQQISDWWAPKLMAIMQYKPDTESFERPHRIPGPEGLLKATLTAPPILLPGFATRAFGWLTAALVLAILLVLLGGYAIYRLHSVTQLAWAMASNKAQGINTNRYAKHRDEFSTLWRVLNSLYARNRSHSRLLVKQTRREAAEKAREMRLLQARLELRQERLTAIGHEIRSPLASLLVETYEDEKVRHRLTRIHNAIETIFNSNSGEDGIQNQIAICTPIDLADYLSRLVKNINTPAIPLTYEGPEQGIVCSIDEFFFETIINHLLDNAKRYRSPNSKIIIRIKSNDETKDAEIEVYNDGPTIPEERLKAIFLYRNSDRTTPQNKGIGLFSARSYLLGMKATINAENRASGVAFVILVPLDSST